MTSLKDDEHSGRVSNVDNDQLRSLVEANPRITVLEIAEELDVATRKITITPTRTEGKSHKLDKQLSHELSDNQNNRSF